MTDNDVIAELTRLLPPDPQHPWKHDRTVFRMRSFSAHLPNGPTVIVEQYLDRVVVGTGFTNIGSGPDFASAVADFLASMSGASQ